MSLKETAAMKANDILQPQDLTPEASRVAGAKDRTTEDPIHEAVQPSEKDSRWNQLIAYGQEQARRLGVTEGDVPRLIAEYRRERRQRR
jgi:hypothetical protein